MADRDLDVVQVCDDVVSNMREGLHYQESC